MNSSSNQDTESCTINKGLVCAQVMCKNKAQIVKWSIHALDISILKYTRLAEDVSHEIKEQKFQTQFKYKPTQKLSYTPKNKLDAG